MLEGEISQINLIERLVELWREEFTGAIRFENDGIIKIIYFKGGDVLSASTNDRADSIDEILTRANKVSREHVKQALNRRKESETLGDAMLNLGYITRKELTWARRVQVVGVIRSIGEWADGSFTIVADYLPKRDEGTLFPLPQILVELIVTEQDRQKFDRAMDGGAAVFSKTGDFGEVFGRLGLNEDADAIVDAIDGTRSAAEVAAASGRDAFNVYKLMQALATLGILSKAQALHEFSLAEGVAADASDAWDDAQTSPAFELDETVAAAQPTIEMSFNADETAAMSSSLPDRSAWDEVEPDESVTPPPAPAWETPLSTVAARIPTPIPAPIEERPLDVPQEPQWGFDEAQLETANRGADQPSAARASTVEPMRGQAAGERKRSGLWIALVLIAVLAGAGYGGFLWWQNRQSAPDEPLVAQRQAIATAPTTTAATSTVASATVASPVAPNTGTIVELPATTGTNDPTATALVPTATAAPTTAPAQPMTITPPPPAVAIQPPPEAAPVPTASGEPTRLDQMAREYAASPVGNFTVQIQILCNPGNLEQAMRQGGGNIWFVPQTIKGRSCYRVFWGHFATREEASRAMASVPAALRDPNAAVKPVPRAQP
jgi:septal ring-binding cell division protein DamX